MSESKSVVTMFLLVQLVTVVFDKFVKSVEFAPVVNAVVVILQKKATYLKYLQSLPAGDRDVRSWWLFFNSYLMHI